MVSRQPAFTFPHNQRLLAAAAQHADARDFVLLARQQSLSAATVLRGDSARPAVRPAEGLR